MDADRKQNRQPNRRRDGGIPLQYAISPLCQRRNSEQLDAEPRQLKTRSAKTPSQLCRFKGIGLIECANHGSLPRARGNVLLAETMDEVLLSSNQNSRLAHPPSETETSLTFVQQQSTSPLTRLTRERVPAKLPITTSASTVIPFHYRPYQRKQVEDDGNVPTGGKLRFGTDALAHLSAEDAGSPPRSM